VKCPSCGSDEAYIGFSDIDCKNNLCKHFQGQATAIGRGSGATPKQVGGLPANMPTFPNPTGPWVFGGAPGPVIAPPNLSIRISRIFPRQNNVQISYIAGGDPGQPDKEVEIYFDVGNGDQICTLSSPNVTHISGVDADGTTVYITNWLCLQDGVKPTDNFQLKATIY